MPMHALATLPLIAQLPSDVFQVWYADDACAGGDVSGLRQWWGSLCERGPQFGYVVNPVKTWFVVKPAHLATAKKLFAGTGVNISVEGRPYLGATIGTREFTHNYIGAKVSEWSSEVPLLAKITESQPQAAYCALTHGLSSRWRFVATTIGELLLPLKM